ncbi:MAG: general secretion pathway protein GspB [Xanthomonadaceae bacterium]|nr:general secretion pathway protein GspB [Xanthomonadaceae bacterium]
MSLILDALRRAEAGRGRDLGQRLAQPLPPHARRKRRSGARLLFGALIVAAGVFGWVLLSPVTDQSPPESAQVPLPEPAPAAPATPSAVSPARGSSLAEIALPVAEREAPVSSAPLLLQLPDDIRATVPELAVNAHFWSADPARRFIVLNMGRYRDGDAVRDGLRVIAVLPEGAELDWRGTRFRINAQ